MSGMFSNFNNTCGPNPFQNTYPLQQLNKAVPAHPNKPYEILSADKSKVEGYFWYYGNSIDLIFDFSDSEYGYTSEYGYLDPNDNFSNSKPVAILVEELLPTLILNATLYNFRHEPILIFSTDSLVSKNRIEVKGTKVIMVITNELSSQLPKGKYCLDLNASHLDGYNETLFNSEMNKLYFEVK